MEHKLEEAFFDGIRKDVQLGHLDWESSMSQMRNIFPDLPLFTFLVISIDGWYLTALFVDKSQVVSNN